MAFGKFLVIKNLLLCLIVFPSYVMASSFIECEIKGDVVGVSENIVLTGEDYLIIDLAVTSVKNTGSYTVEDCDPFSSGVHEIHLKKDKEQPANLDVGDVVTVKYFYVDSVNRRTPEKYEGTAVWQLMSID